MNIAKVLGRLNVSYDFRALGTSELFRELLRPLSARRTVGRGTRGVAPADMAVDRGSNNVPRWNDAETPQRQGYVGTVQDGSSLQRGDLECNQVVA
jgi:hypothetical protein